MVSTKPQRAVLIVRDRKAIRLLADFTRLEIIRLLSKRPMTETQLSGELGLTKAAVGYHLHLLLDAGLIQVAKLEVEAHGIMQKYYAPAASLFIVDPDCIPDDVKRFFIQLQIEHLRGMFSVFRLYHRVSEVSSEDLERLAIAMLRQLKSVGEKCLEAEAPEDPEALRVRVYAEALANLTEEKEWRNLFKETL
ncbi:MAG: Helix-turn-helix domain [Candidatus Bathyarchaeota archaeon B26-2]|nr:MAG: Helix-turn-helix domain [Candidatus Bathyarchaeota archaeon B26-2]